MRVLVLGGTTEGRLLATALASDPSTEVVISLAGRVRAPVPLPGEVRVGGFGGPGGLAGWLRERGIDAVVDATHPFATRMTEHAALGAAQAGVPLVVVRRPGAVPEPGDRWTPVESLPAAAALLPGMGERIFLTTGRMGLAAFADLDLWFLVRSVDPPEPPVPRRMHVVLDRGPFTRDGESGMLREHRIDVLVTKDSGAVVTAAKLGAARDLGIPVVMVRRPPARPGLDTVETVDAALAWLRARR